VIAVPDDERERRSQRQPVTKPGEDLELVGLELLSWAPAVALTAALEVARDRVRIESESRRQAGDDRDERRAVRFARRGQTQCHEGNPKAFLMTSTGAWRPVHSSNAATPCARRTSSPETT
jgi:hypothetical protein